MLNAVRAMAATIGLATADLNDPRPEDLARFAVSMRRLTPLEAALSMMNAQRRAEMTSLWADAGKALCRVRSAYANAAARFGGIVRLTPAEAPPAPAGARALWDRLAAAGFVTGDAGLPAATATASHAVGATVVRVLQETPARRRRTAWTEDGARRAA